MKAHVTQILDNVALIEQDKFYVSHDNMNDMARVILLALIFLYSPKMQIDVKINVSMKASCKRKM